MLQDLYHVKATGTGGGIFKFKIILNPGSVIFKGHFPGQPVLPGACMLQMVKELAESVAAKKLTLQKADNLKFLSFIDPAKDQEFDAELSILEIGTGLKINAVFKSSETTFFKLSGVFNHIAMPVNHVTKINLQ